MASEGAIKQAATRRRDYTVANEAGTVALAERLGREFGPGAVFALYGEMGLGKTRFAQGLALALGVNEPVSSPTFTLINEYATRDGGRFVHMDLYRLSDEDAVVELGFEEYLETAAVLAIEWPERAARLLPPTTIHVQLLPGQDEESRHVQITWQP